MKEHDEQAAVVRWLDFAHPNVLKHSIPNGAELAGKTIGQRVARMNKLKAEGLTPGASDLFIAEPRGGFHGMYLEMKSTTGRLSDNQQWFLSEAEQRHYYTAVAHGAAEAIDTITEYLSWDNQTDTHQITATTSTTAQRRGDSSPKLPRVGVPIIKQEPSAPRFPQGSKR